ATWSRSEPGGIPIVELPAVLAKSDGTTIVAPYDAISGQRQTTAAADLPPNTHVQFRTMLFLTTIRILAPRNPFTNFENGFRFASGDRFGNFDFTSRLMPQSASSASSTS